VIVVGARVLVGRTPRFVLAPLLRYIATWRDPSLGATAELGGAVRQARRALPLVQVPALVMHGRDDVIVAPANAEAILRGLASAQKELVWWDDTTPATRCSSRGHMAPRYTPALWHSSQG